MATATKKARNWAKTSNKSTNKKALAKKAANVKSANAKTPANLVEKAKRTEADGFTAKSTAIKTGKSVSQEAKKTLSENGKIVGRERQIPPKPRQKNRRKITAA